MVFKPLYNKYIQMSQQRQVQISKSTALKSQKPKTQLNSNQPELVLSSSSFSENLQFDAEFYEENGHKSKSGQGFPYLRNQVSLQCEVKEEEWTPEQENMLIQLHNKKGNKWAQIARQLKRNDNSIKNHYHAKLRRAWRKLNKYIADHLSGQLRSLKGNLISKVVQTAEGLYTGKLGAERDIALRAYDLKNKLLSYSQFNEQQITIQQLTLIKQLVLDLLKFEQSFKNNFKNEVKTKVPTVRFKGKEIFVLLAERQRALSFYKPYKCYRSSNQNKPKAQKKQIPSNTPKKQQKELKVVIPSVNKQNSIGNVAETYSNPSIYYYNDGTNNYQSFYFVGYQQAAGLYPGQASSYNPYDPLASQLGQWNTSTGLEDYQYIPAQELLIKNYNGEGNDYSS